MLRVAVLASFGAISESLMIHKPVTVSIQSFLHGTVCISVCALLVWRSCYIWIVAKGGACDRFSFVGGAETTSNLGV